MDRVQLFGIQIDRISMSQAVAEVSGWINQRNGRCRYVVTPNVDHAVMFQERPELRDAYRGASLVLADGAPVVWASRLLRKALPERVAGSDLTPQLFQTAQTTRPLRTFLLGAGPGVALKAAAKISKRWPAVEVVGTYSPPMGFEHNELENASIIERINSVHPDLLILGLGAPKQELWIHKHHERISASAALCVGAVIDFLAGEKARAPQALQRLGLEWLHRLASEPKRLAKRYARDAWIFPQLVWREFRGSGKTA
jgi:N-acetylglucosaminyldiphosphoundecaprenol N-acetyl-beta-D-mannosaminyltransferase